MKNGSEHVIRDAVRRLVSEQVDGVPLDDSANFLESTNLDSLGIVELIVALEEEFSIDIDLATSDPESLLSINGLTHQLSMLMDETRN
jgi:acyl carrier protein